MNTVCTLGIAHPPGYPLFVLLVRLFTVLPFGDAAYRASVMVAFFAACAAATVYAIAHSELSTARAGRAVGVPGRRDSVVELSALAGTLAFGIALTFWSQATVAEVYSLSSALGGLVACLTAAVVSNHEAARGKLLFAGLGLLGGLSLAHDLALAVWPGVLALSALQKASQDERQDRRETGIEGLAATGPRAVLPSRTVAR